MSTSVMFENVVGQDRVKKSAEVAIVAAQQKQQALGHFAIHGEGGLGKSRMVNEIIQATGLPSVRTQGSKFANIEEMNAFLIEHTVWENGKPKIIFIDEAHQLSIKIQEEMYVPLEEFKILPNIILPPFTLAIATTRLDKLDGKSFVERFKHKWQLRPLSHNETIFLLTKHFGTLGIDCWWHSLDKIAARSRGVPRKAIGFADKAADYALFNKRREVTLEDVEAAFSELGIDENGLNEDQRNYLLALKDGETLSLRDLTARLGIQSEEVVKYTIEPDIVNLGLVRSNSRGRCLSAAGVRYFNGTVGPKLMAE